MMVCTKRLSGVFLVGIIAIGSSDALNAIDIIDTVGNTVWRTFNYIVPDVLNPLNLVYSNSCIEDLGCFYTGPPFFHPFQRPLSFAPSNRLDEINFLLFTQASPNEPYVLEPNLESLENSTFDPTHKTTVLIHGFLVDFDYDEVRYEMKDAVIKDPADYNAIVVDWDGLNSPPYSQAVANTRVVGAKLAKLINFIVNNTETTAASFHIVGHSLGAHIAGYAGERIEGLARITGLDPAGPYFRDPQVRLDSTDALFVDVIHTDGGGFLLTGLGIDEPIGHVNFYPNDGRMQPGCDHTVSGQGFLGAIFNFFLQFLLVTSKYVFSSCDHGRANDYYLESISNYECTFLAVQCSDYDDFEAGLCSPCNHTVAVMGFRNKALPGIEPSAKFFLKTNAQSPFCQERSICIRPSNA